MNEYKLGDMVKVKVKVYNSKIQDIDLRIAHGMITQLRMKPEIAYVEFLPIEKTASQWIAFSAIVE